MSEKPSEKIRKTPLDSQDSFRDGTRRPCYARCPSSHPTAYAKREIEMAVVVVGNAAIFSLFLYTGCRFSDLVALELHDLMLSDRSGTAVFRFAKGNKQRSVPLPLRAWQALQAYLESRPPTETSRVFVGERGPLTGRRQEPAAQAAFPRILPSSAWSEALLAHPLAIILAVKPSPSWRTRCMKWAIKRMPLREAMPAR